MGENARKAYMAQRHIKRGRELLREIGADKAARRVNMALKSVDGARRNARGRDHRATKIILGSAVVDLGVWRPGMTTELRT